MSISLSLPFELPENFEEEKEEDVKISEDENEEIHSEDDEVIRDLKPRYEDFKELPLSEIPEYLKPPFSIRSITEYSDGTFQLTSKNPKFHQMFDFWKEIILNDVGLIVMDSEDYCTQYVPKNNQEEFGCGGFLIRRLTDVEQPNEHCQIQKFVVRNNEMEESVGWYPIWHCSRTQKEDIDKKQQEKEFDGLKMKLLKDVKKTHYLVHKAKRSIRASAY